MQTQNQQEKIVKPEKSKIQVNENDSSIQIVIPAKGLNGKGLITLIVIGVWLFTILIWTVILLFMKPINALYSIPFWAIGLLTLFKSMNMLRIEQVITLKKDSITLKIKQGIKYDEKIFNINDSSVNFIEGSYYSFTGLNRRGQFPAIIFNNESYSFGERCSISEKSWLLNLIKEYYKN
ncbi:MAG: hypothetical protein ACM3RX_04855 [Methanococcaceae archaeon]